MRKIPVLLLALTSVVALAPISSATANAAEKQTVFFEEKFEENQLSRTKWDVSTASESMNLMAIEDTGHLVSEKAQPATFRLTTEDKIKKLESLQVDMLIEDGCWNAIYFDEVNDYTDNGWEFQDENYALDLVINNAANPAEDGFHCWGGNCNLSAHYTIEAKWSTFLMEVTSPTSANIYWGKQGTDVKANGVAAYLTVKDGANYSFDDLYILFSSSGFFAYRMDNLKIVSENVNIDENFNQPEIDPQIIARTTKEEYNYVIEKADAFLSVESAQAGDSIVYSTAVPREVAPLTDLEVIKAQYDASFNGAADGDALAFAFGISQDTKKYTDGCYAVVMEKDGVSFAKYADGQWLTLVEKQAADFSEVAGETVTVVVNKNGKVTASVKGEKLLEATVDAENFYVGHMGFVATKANGGNIYIDDVKALTTTYKVPVSKSVYHNFSNDFFGNKGYEDFVTNSVGGSQYVKDGKLVWEGLSDFSYFGSAHEYDDFILDFEISNIYITEDDAAFTEATASERWIGIDLAKRTNLQDKYGSYVTLILTITPTGDVATLSPHSSDGGVTATEVAKGFKKHQDIPASYFTAIQYNNMEKTKDDVAEGDAICCRFVAENGTIRFYLKKACEAEYQLYYTIENVDTTGYTALCCTGFTFLELDNFAMSNISGLYTTPDPYAPEKEIITETEVVYDKANVDVNALEEALLNMDSAKLQELLKDVDPEVVREILKNAGKDPDDYLQEDQGGCGSQIHAAYALVPMMLAGCFLIYKQTKRRDEK